MDTVRLVEAIRERWVSELSKEELDEAIQLGLRALRSDVDFQEAYRQATEQFTEKEVNGGVSWQSSVDSMFREKELP